MIEIDGLTDRQHGIATLLWGCNTHDEITALINNLPSKSDKLAALSIVKIMAQDAREVYPEYKTAWSRAGREAVTICNQFRLGQ